MELKQFDFGDCLREGLIRIIPTSNQQTENSINTARKWLDEAEKSFSAKAFNSTMIASYLTMFHSSKSILFRDGFREKSHYCVARYLEEKYSKMNILEFKWIEVLDYYRETRHKDQYNTNFFVSENEAKDSIKNAKEFLKRIESLLEKG